MLHIGASGAATLSSILRLLNKDLINPSPNDSFCTVDVYPVGCNSKDNYECFGGNGHDLNNFSDVYTATMGIGFGTLVVTMGLIIQAF